MIELMWNGTETWRALEAARIYVEDLRADRSLEGVVRRLGPWKGYPGVVRRWAFKHSWIERAAEFDVRFLADKRFWREAADFQASSDAKMQVIQFRDALYAPFETAASRVRDLMTPGRPAPPRPGELLRALGAMEAARPMAVEALLLSGDAESARLAVAVEAHEAKARSAAMLAEALGIRTDVDLGAN